MTSRFFGIAAFVSGLSLGICACSAKKDIVKLVETDYCYPLEDDYDGSIMQGRRERLSAHGEAGERALLKLVREGGEVQACALGYLCEFRDRRAIPLSVQLLKEDASDVDTLKTALGCLGQTGDTQFIRNIQPYLRSSKINVSLAAVRSLAMIDDESVRVLLRDLLVRPEHAHFQHHVIEALAHLRDTEAVPLLLEEEKKPETNSPVRREIVEALTTIDAIGTFEELLEIVLKIKRRRSRLRALEYVIGGLEGQLASLPEDAHEERSKIEKAIEEVKHHIRSINLYRHNGS